MLALAVGPGGVLGSSSWASAQPAPAATCGDLNGSDTLTSVDALLALKGAVGQDVDLLCPPPGMPVRTGQTKCYDEDGAVIPCSGTNQDGELRSGAARSFVDNGDGTISDGATGLMWEKLSHDTSVHDFDNSYTWAGAFDEKIATLNSQQFAGYSDWRLPNRFELDSLVDLGTTEPAMPAFFDDNCVPACTVLTCSCATGSTFWTSTSADGVPDSAWVVRFSKGYTDRLPKTGFLSVRAVRGGF